MFDLSAVFEFSTSHCIAICAMLVPANLLATLQTMLFLGFGRPLAQIQLMAVISTLYAGLLLFHVYTWFAIGVVMAPTYILIALGCVCLSINVLSVVWSWKWPRPVWILQRL